MKNLSSLIGYFNKFKIFKGFYIKTEKYKKIFTINLC